MSKNEKAALQSGKSNNLNELTMGNFNTNHEKTQNVFSFETELIPQKTKQKILHFECYECGDHEPTAGYRFRLVRVCEGCRVECEVEIVGNRFERRRANR